MKIAILLLGLLGVLPATAETIQLSTQRQVKTPISGNSLPVVVNGVPFSRVCWYQGQEYSEGAPLEVAGVLMICLPKNDFETNGPLMWLTREQSEKQRRKR
ncbi:MAG: DUF1496 domain-containing protein [Endozoicomonas sp.]